MIMHVKKILTPSFGPANRGNTSTQISIVAHSKGVYGLVFDELRPERLATFSEGETIKIWDMRKIDTSNPTPIVQIQTPGNSGVTQVAWSPIRNGVLGVIQDNSPKVSLYDINISNAPNSGLITMPYHSRTVSVGMSSVLIGLLVYRFKDIVGNDDSGLSTIKKRRSVEICAVGQLYRSAYKKRILVE
jgi:WD40 repeat protein